MKKSQVEVCHTPLLLKAYEPEDKIIVVVDLFRASTAICTAIHYGVKSIIPVREIEQAHDYRKKGYIVAAERNGEVVTGFKLGNSPYSYMTDELEGQTVILTTTNCTRAIHEATSGEMVVVGAFANITALTEFLYNKDQSVIILCAGWRNRYSLEDTLFAGALALRLEKAGFEIDDDAAISSIRMYESALPDVRGFLRASSHSQRLKKLNIEKDIEFCLQSDSTDVIPVFDGNVISALHVHSR